MEATQDHDALIAQVEASRIAKEVERAKCWRQLVVDFTDAAITDPDEISESLEYCGKTPAELKAAKDVLIQRRADRATLDRLAVNEAERIEIGKAKQVELDRFAPLHKEHQQVLLNLEYRMQRITSEMPLAMAAQDRLRRTSPLRDEMHAVLKAIKEVEAQLAPVTRDLFDREHAAEGYKSSCRDERLSEMRRFEAQENLKATQRRISEIQKVLQPLEARLAELRAKSDELHVAMLQP